MPPFLTIARPWRLCHNGHNTHKKQSHRCACGKPYPASFSKIGLRPFGFRLSTKGFGGHFWLFRDPCSIHLNLATCKWWFPTSFLLKKPHVSIGWANLYLLRSPGSSSPILMTPSGACLVGEHQAQALRLRDSCVSPAAYVGRSTLGC